MPLTKCPECNKEISDKAEACPNCGYPFAKLNTKKIHQVKRKVKAKIEIQGNPLFPKLPDNLDIGQPLSSYKSKFNFYGNYNPDDSLIFDAGFYYSARMVLSIHERGLMIKEIERTQKTFIEYELNNMNLHFSLIISLKKATLLQMHKDQNLATDETPLDEKLFSGSTSSKSKFIMQFFAKEYERTSILVVNYWNVEFQYPKSFVIRGRGKRISNFINSFEEAKSNFENGIPNVPDLKGDNIRTIIFGSAILVFVLFLLIAVIRAFFFT